MRTLIRIARSFAQALYALMRVRPRRRKVVLLSRQADTPSRDFRMLVDELRRLDPSVEVVVRCRFVPAGLIGRAAYAGEVLAQMWHLADASVCVVDGYIVPVSILDHGRGLTVIQMWHALGAIKKFGLQSVGRSGGRSAVLADAMRMHRNYDHVLCGGPGSVSAFAEAFGVPESSVRTIGLPRVDALLAAARPGAPEPAAVRELRTRFPRLDEPGRTVVLYAPTFRRDTLTEFGPMIEAFADDRFTLVVKPHDLEQTVTGAANVVDAAGVDSMDLLPIADAVVTDYSAIAYEAAVAGTPVYYYVYDIDEYRESHGLNIDPLAEWPSATSTDAGEVARKVAAGSVRRVDTDAFRERYVSVPPEGSTRALVALVTDHLP